jgi:hypothetical protein
LEKFEDYTLSDVIGKNKESLALRRNPYFVFGEMVRKLRESKNSFERKKLQVLPEAFDEPS